MSVVIVGGGLSGLAAAARLLDLDPSLDVEILEASERTGGWLQTLERDGFVIDLGPDSIITDKPAALALVRRLGLEPRVVRTVGARAGAYVVSAGRLVRVPAGFSLMAPVDLGAFALSPALSIGGRVRAVLEVLVPPRPASEPEESLASFVRRRFGDELFERLGQPLVSGIYGGDAETLSLAATMPRFIEMEQRAGSVIRAMRARRNEAASGARYGLFINFDRGMRVLIDALEERVGRDRIRLRTRVRQVEPSQGQWAITLEDGTTRIASSVIVALNARLARGIFGAPLAPLVAELEPLRFGSAATITFAWKTSEIPRPLDAFGFVVPEIERRAVLASTWSSAKWPGRAPAGWALIRVFVGGVRDQDAARREDDDLIATARRELRALMGIEAEPAFSLVVRYPDAMPLYQLGHLARVSAIERELERHPGLALAGNSLRGVGIPDAIASGERAAERVHADLAARRAS